MISPDQPHDSTPAAAREPADERIVAADGAAPASSACKAPSAPPGMITLMDTELSATARRLGIRAAVLVVVLETLYAVALVIGMVALESPDQPIADPMFTILELLILLVAPAMVSVMVAIHAWAPRALRALSLSAVVFMSLSALITSAVHFTILTVSRTEAFSGQSWTPLLFSFRWPSVVYALDILAWDVFFAISVLFAAAVFRGAGLETWLRRLFMLSGLLALAGLSGVMVGSMQLRNIGIVGYVPVFMTACCLLVVLFRRSRRLPV